MPSKRTPKPFEQAADLKDSIIGTLADMYPECRGLASEDSPLKWLLMYFSTADLLAIKQDTKTWVR
jgi:hypothetical protein